MGEFPFELPSNLDNIFELFRPLGGRTGEVFNTKKFDAFDGKLHNDD